MADEVRERLINVLKDEFPTLDGAGWDCLPHNPTFFKNTADRLLAQFLIHGLRLTAIKTYPPMHSGDRVKIKGSYETGLVTGFPTDDTVRVYWNSTNNMYTETDGREYLQVVECPHENS